MAPSLPPCTHGPQAHTKAAGHDIQIASEVFEVAIEVFDMGLHTGLSYLEKHMITWCDCVSIMPD